MEHEHHGQEEMEVRSNSGRRKRMAQSCDVLKAIIQFVPFIVDSYHQSHSPIHPLFQVPSTSYNPPSSQPSQMGDITRDLGDASSISSSQVRLSFVLDL